VEGARVVGCQIREQTQELGPGKNRQQLSAIRAGELGRSERSEHDLSAAGNGSVHAATCEITAGTTLRKRVFCTVVARGYLHTGHSGVPDDIGMKDLSEREDRGDEILDAASGRAGAHRWPGASTTAA
jgi:hypothetical protein